MDGHRSNTWQTLAHGNLGRPRTSYDSSTVNVSDDRATKEGGGIDSWRRQAARDRTWRSMTTGRMSWRQPMRGAHGSCSWQLLEDDYNGSQQHTALQGRPHAPDTTHGGVVLAHDDGATKDALNPSRHTTLQGITAHGTWQLAATHESAGERAAGHG